MIDLEVLAARIGGVRGVIGVVLGGSRARGTADEHSDADLGVYRRGAELDLSALRELAAEHPGSVVAEPGEWGPWVDGGAWLATPGAKTDLLWRDLDRVEQVLAEVRSGVVRCEQQNGHPLGYFSHGYLAELATAQVLHDPSGQLAAVQAQLRPYPVELAEAIERVYGWEAGFSLANAETPAKRGDWLFVSGCVFRALGCLVQVLHAREHVWLATEKGAVASAARLARAPRGFAARVAEALHPSAAGLAAAHALLADCALA
ncbi:nucleotidyltransferase domain-containing protein [Kutzneria viridogrisea]|uniref:Nucleotidyltransferase domain-containing protein n=1 Tax=Kutzneria viridogrisea TaxID=47990 RepID=A0ABR6BNC2_9PSEU|nr:hypothetical protein [Kutzneria viridogrisea]